MKEFIDLHNRTTTRDEIQAVIDLAKEQNNTEVIYRLSKILNDHPDSTRFKLNIINYPQETTNQVALAGTRHLGDYREALDECGRLKKGWHFVDGKVVKVQKRSGLLSQYTEKEFGHPFTKTLKAKFKELNWKYDRKNKRYYTPVPENEVEKAQQAQMFAFIEQEKAALEINKPQKATKSPSDKSSSSSQKKTSSKRLEILENSLKKKENKFNERFKDYLSDVKSANGQPLNDKRNGISTLNRWGKKEDSLRTIEKDIEKTKQAIEQEQKKIDNVNFVNEYIPQPIKDLVEKGILNQWRKYPNRFFVEGVEKARIIFDKEKGTVLNQYYKSIPTKEQREKFAKVFNELKDSLNAIPLEERTAQAQEERRRQKEANLNYLNKEIAETLARIERFESKSQENKTFAKEIKSLNNEKLKQAEKKAEWNSDEFYYITDISYYNRLLKQRESEENPKTDIKSTLNAPNSLFGTPPEINTLAFKKMKVTELRAFTLEFYRLFLKGKKKEIEKHLKEVVFTSEGGRKIAYGEAMYSAKAAVIEHLGSLIKNSTYNNWGDRKPSDSEEILGYLNFKSKITIDGKKRHVRIAISVDKDRNLKFKSYDVGKKKSASTHKGVKPFNGGAETLSNESTAKTVPNFVLSAPRHAGILKEALTEKGKLKKGWYFQDYGIIDPKGKYHPLERDYSLEYNLIEKELRDRAFQQDEKRKIKGFEENKKLEEAIKVFLKELSKENKKHFKNNKAMEVFYWAFPFTLERNSTFYTFEESNPYINKNLQELDKYFSDDNELFERLENYETLRRYRLKSLGLHISAKISSFIDKQGKVIRGDSNKLNQKYGLSAPEVFVEHSPDPATQSAPSITPRNNSLANKMATLQNRTFETFIIAEPQMQAFLGDVERKTTGSTAITLTGGAGSGKTRFAFQFINALAQNYKVGHASLEEQPDSKLYFDKVHQYLDETAQANVEAPEIENMQDLQALIERNDVIVIDSFTKIREWERNFLLDRDLRKKYNGKLFLIIFQQTSAGNMRGGSESEFDGDIILFTNVFPDYRENYIYPSKNRYNSTPREQLRYSVYYQQLLPDESSPSESSPATSNTYEVIY